MWRFGTAIVGFGILVGCNELAPATMDTPISRASVPPVTVAWGERIDLGANTRKVLITYPGNPNGSQIFEISQRLFDIPAPPVDSETLGLETSVSLETYNTALNPISIYSARRASCQRRSQSRNRYLHAVWICGQRGNQFLGEYLESILHQFQFSSHHSFESSKHSRI